MNATPKKEAWLKTFHRVLYPGSSVREATLKSNIRQFSGFSDTSEEHNEKVAEKLNKLDLVNLKNITDLIDVERSGTKAQITERIVEFLNNPQSSGKEFRQKVRAPKKKAATKGKKKTKKVAEKVKRPPSAYILFCKASREKVAKSNPDASFGEIGKLLGAKWKGLNADQKEVWTAKAEEVAKNFNPTAVKKKTKAKAKAKKPAAKKKAKKEESEDDEETSDEEEEEEEVDDADIKKRLAASVKKIVQAGTASELTLGLIKSKLRKEFGESVVSDYKPFIKSTVQSLF